MRTRRTLGLGIGLAAVLGGAWMLLPPAPAPVPFAASAVTPPPPDVRFSLFALGDTGEQHAFPTLTEGQLAVARALTAHDIAAPVDAVLFLGDNFYPDGLARDVLVERISLNLVWPYCRFVALDGARSPEVADACPLPAALRRAPAPRLLSVLGNHDYALPESAELQRDTIPEFITNWQVPRGPADVIALAPGLSLVLVDVEMTRDDDARARITDVLRASPGPWRIVAAHNPIAERADGKRYNRRLREALRAADVPFQLFLSGHDHDLRVIEMGPPGPALHVISGGGATRKPIEHDYVGQRFASSATGFVRVDWIGNEGGEELLVSVYATPRYPAWFWRESERVARWSISRAGEVRPR